MHLTAGLNSPPWPEAERIPASLLPSLFQPSPHAPAELHRSALVIGARGAGKSTYLKHLTSNHQGIAVSISLPTELFPIVKQTGAGFIHHEVSEEFDRQVAGKTITLIALAVSARLIDVGIKVPPKLLQICLPRSLDASRLTSNAILTDLFPAAADEPMVSFDGLSQRAPLVTFLREIGKASLGAGQPLLVAFDRADLVVLPSLTPILELLDQSETYTAVVAMRPGPIGRSVRRLVEAVRPGDLYDLIHLGLAPRSDEWSQFVIASVGAQFGPRLADLETTALEVVVTMSRDSVRTALELTGRLINTGSGHNPNALVKVLSNARDTHLTYAEQTLQQYHPDFRGFIRDAKASATDRGGVIDGPVIVELTELGQQSMFDVVTRTSRMIDMALHSNALCLPDSTMWSPGLRPRELELPPLFVWSRGEPFWSRHGSSPHRIRRSEPELITASGGGNTKPSIFIGYRMRSDESVQFRKDIEARVRTYPRLASADVKDGNFPRGVEWAGEIRKRLSKSSIMVGDVEDRSPEVFFELGFATGLRKPTIPVVKSPVGRQTLPDWLNATNVGYYGTDSGLGQIVSSIDALLSDPDISKPPRPRTAIPALAVWLRPLPWAERTVDHFRDTADRFSLKPEVYEESVADSAMLRRAVVAGLLIICLDGTKHDSLMHFVAGAVVARPQSGYNSRFKRMIVVLQEPQLSGSQPLAESLKRCDDMIHIVKPADVRGLVETYGAQYSAWSRTAPPSKV